MRATFITFALAAAASVGLLAPVAVASAADSAVATIGLLEAEGFDVQIDRIGSAQLEDCVVTDVRNPRELKELRRIRRGDRDVFIEVVVRRTITVSLDCTRR